MVSLAPAPSSLPPLTSSSPPLVSPPVPLDQVNQVARPSPRPRPRPARKGRRGTLPFLSFLRSVAAHLPCCFFPVEQKTASGLYLPSAASQGPPPEGTVLAVGPGAPGKDGKLQPLSVKEGDRVVLPGFGGIPVKVGEEVRTDLECLRVREMLTGPHATQEYHIFRDAEIIAKLSE